MGGEGLDQSPEGNVGRGPSLTANTLNWKAQLSTPPQSQGCNREDFLGTQTPIPASFRGVRLCPIPLGGCPSVHQALLGH